jgi:3-phosphoshikimate 1-carboxyvinyltransferase
LGPAIDYGVRHALKLPVAKKIVAPAKKIEGVVEFPGDKSISHRYAILAALAEGTSELHNYASATDCQSTLDCLRRLGVKIEKDQQVVRITGAGLHGLKASRRALDAGNSGTTIRLMAGMLAGQPFASELTGDGSLRRRPMRRILTPLAQMGAEIHAADEGRAPLKISGAKLRAIDYTVPVPSAQVKSAVLLAGLYADGVTTVRESYGTRDHTEIALREFGAEVSGGRGAPSVQSQPKLTARSLLIPGDLSAAVFFLGAALILPDSNLLLHNVGLNPTRTRILDFLISMGASIHLASVQWRDGELTGDVAVRHSQLDGGKISGAEVAEMIDELPMVAALGPFTENGIEICDAQELRVKESDRIAALTEGLRRMGAQVREFPDGMWVAGRTAGRLRGATVDPQGDHRIAMALAVAGLGAEGSTTIMDAECAGVSFPEFFATLDRALER